MTCGNYTAINPPVRDEILYSQPEPEKARISDHVVEGLDGEFGSDW